MPENWLANAVPFPRHADASVMLLRSMQNTRSERMDAKAENDVCVMMLPLVVVGCTSKQSVSQCGRPYLFMDNAASRLADTAERDYFTLRERLITMQKQLEGTQKYINEQCR